MDGQSWRADNLDGVLMGVKLASLSCVARVVDVYFHAKRAGQISFDIIEPNLAAKNKCNLLVQRDTMLNFVI